MVVVLFALSEGVIGRFYPVLATSLTLTTGPSYSEEALQQSIQLSLQFAAFEFLLTKLVFFLACIFVVLRIEELPQRIPRLALANSILGAVIVYSASLLTLYVLANFGIVELRIQSVAQKMLSDAFRFPWFTLFGLLGLSFSYFLLLLAAFAFSLMKERKQRLEAPQRR